MKKVIFEGIDSWNRPIFKDVSVTDGRKSCSRYSAVDILFDRDATAKEVLQQVGNDDLTYHGESFECEPWGSSCNVEIVVDHQL